ncbi:MAG TPA: helix-turn-helix transcriptional regulator [Rhizobiaceae bacterium]|nr:helix-turn-helix transcriptional regulator [Rhizobiaceae bacterium]
MASGNDRDVEAILKLLRAESEAFWNKDIEAYKRCWVNAPYVRRTGWWSLGGVTWRVGWDEIERRTREQFAAFPEKNATPETMWRENMVIRVGKDMAWVSYDQHATDQGEPIIDMPGLSRETKILEKHEGEWKLVYLCYLHRTTHQMSSAVVQIDGERRVIWKNPAAETELAGDCGLVIRAGRLRALDRAADQRLTATVDWAAKLDEGLEGRREAVPIVLEGGRGEPANVCWVIADSGVILVAINDRAAASDRLKRASLIYGISASQAALASEIIAGRDLREASENLGISVNTARTQLQRMFDKTGVRSQAALVRALLSVSAPGE